MSSAPLRILFVDDYEVLLGSLRRAARLEPSWEVETARGGNEALALMARRPFDVVVSDMEMPGMSGLELLARVRELTPRCARLMMSAQLDADAFVRATAVMHRFLPKPFPVADLRATLRQLQELRERLPDARLQALVGKAVLPSAPRVYLELTRAAADPSTSVADLATIVEKDTAVAAKLLSLAGSAYFGAGPEPLSVEGAVARLGVEMTRALCLAAHVLSLGKDDLGLPPRLRLSALYDAALATARLARALAGTHRDVAFLGALLADVGLVALLGRRRDLVLELERRPTPEPRTDAERRLLGATVPELGAYLLGLWGLPHAVVEAVLQQRQAPAQLPLGATGAVWLAHALIDERTGAEPQHDREGLARLGLLEDLPRLRARAAAVTSS